MKCGFRATLSETGEAGEKGRSLDQKLSFSRPVYPQFEVMLGGPYLHLRSQPLMLVSCSMTGMNDTARTYLQQELI